MSSFSYVIDISPGCNLKCVYCPVDNSREIARPRKMMPIDLYRDILRKIKHENPAGANIALYNWTEPLLNPLLPQFVIETNAVGFHVILSSNLNIGDRLDEIVRANPYMLKITVSGFKQETYEKSHAGGNIETVKLNMQELSNALRKHNSQTQVDVMYLCYTYNLGSDLEDMRKFSKNLGFSFSPVWAYLMPLDKLLQCYEGELPESQNDKLSMLAIHPNEAREISLRHTERDCNLRKEQTAINSDGSVALCCTVYDMNLGAIVDSFLDTPHKVLQEKKYSHALCNKCMHHGAHVTSIYTFLDELNKIAARRIAPYAVPEELQKRALGPIKKLRHKIKQALKLNLCNCGCL